MESPQPIDERLIEHLAWVPASFPRDARQALEALLSLDCTSHQTLAFYRDYYDELQALQNTLQADDPATAARLKAFTASLFAQRLPGNV